MKNLYSRWKGATLIALFIKLKNTIAERQPVSPLSWKLVMPFFFLVLAFCPVSAQTITNYSFTASNGTFTANTSGTVPGGTGTIDEGVFNTIPLGFDFYYLGTRYTTISATTNGWFTLGAAITAATPLNNLTSGGAPRPILAPLWDDLLITNQNNITYVTTGSAGNRVFSIEFVNNKWSPGANQPVISYQVKLYESTGKIEYIYRPENAQVDVGSASIGLGSTATGSGNFLSLNGFGTSPTASSTVETTTINAKPASGQTYGFVAAASAAPTALTFTAITNSSMTLNWLDNASNESGYVIYRSMDGVTYSFVNQLAPNSTSATQTGLAGLTTYYYKVYALREGNLGTALAGTQATVCPAPAAPTVTTPVNLCQYANASALTATGSNLLWGGASGTVGGTAALSTTSYVDNSFSNKKTNFTTSVANVTVTSIDYYIPAYQTVTGLVLSIYNGAGTIIATSSTTTSTTAGAGAVKISAAFNYTIAAAGSYSIGISAGTGNIGSDNPTFPLTEVTGTVSITGVTTAGVRCFNNIVFSTGSSASAPTPTTGTTGSQTYYVTQTVGGCTSAMSSILVNVTSPNISQVPTSGIIAYLPFTGNANDVSANNNPGTLQNAPVLVADRFGQTNKAYSFNGSTQYISTSKSYVNPTNFTVSTWFKTSTVTGGKLIGFSASQTGLSTQYDRHVYMSNSGQLYFGVYPGSVVTVSSPLSYNDNKWHLVTATLSSSTGMVLYVDGAVVGSNSTVLTAENYTGYWRIGYDNLSGWPSPPTSNYFNGSLDDVLIYNRALSSSEVNTLYTSPDGAGNNGPVCAGSALNLSLSATGIAGATYSWTGPNSFTSTLQNPSLTFTAAAAGTYSLVVTSGGCSSTAYTNVIASTVGGQWTGNISTDWNNANNWCSGTVPTSTINVTIPVGALRMPVISTTASCNNLSIASTASLTTNLAASLSIAGTLTNSGTMTNNGTTIFNGTSGQQNFTGVTAFNNLEVNNAAGLILPTAITMTGNVTLTTGILNSNNFSIFLSGSWLNNSAANAFTAGTAIVTFQGNTAQTIGGTFVTSFNNLVIDKTPATLTLNSNELIGGNLTVTSGTLDLGVYTANRVSAGGTIMVDNNAVLKIGGTNTFPTNYSSNNLVIASTVEYAGTNQTVSNQLYGNLKLSSSAGAAVKTLPATSMTIGGNFTTLLGGGSSVTATAAASINVNGAVNIGASTTFNGASYTQTISGNWVNSGTFNGNTGTVVFNGTASNVSGAGVQNFNNLTVAASSIVFANNSLTLSGNLATSGAGSFSQATGGTLIMTGAAKTITGSGISIDNFTVSGSVSTAISLNLTGNLLVTGTFTASAGTVIMSGAAKTISGSGAASFNYLNITGSETATSNFTINAGLIVDGSFSASAGAATFIGTSTLSGRANLFNTVINGTKLQLSANSILGVAGAITISAGVLDVISSIPNSVEYNGASQNITATTYDRLTLTNGGIKTALSAMTVNNLFTIGASTNFAAGNFTHNFYNDWVNDGTFSASTGTIRFTGTNTSNISGLNAFNILTVDKSTANTTVQLLSDASATTLNMTSGLMLTGSKTISLSVTRTGPGIILGNINRTHAFTTGIDYAFEGPNNTINFSSVSGVTSVTVSVTKGSIADFPSGASISRMYNISVPAGTYTAKLRLHYEDNELNGNDETQMGLWNYNGAVWSSAGAKSGSDASTNYVENSGLTNITNRWTLSGAVSEFTWSGAIDIDWNKPGNWKFGGAAASRIPASTDVVKIGTEAFSSQPTISTSVTVKNIILGSVQAVSLSMAGGGSLISGDISGTWSSNVTHNFNVNNQSVTINGDLTLSDGTVNHKINLNIGNGTLTTTGTLTESGTADISFSGTGILKIGTNLNRIDGVFTAGAGTVEFNGSANQALGNITFYHLNINKTGGAANASQLLTINGNLNVMAGTMTNNTTAVIKGNVTTFVGGILDNENILQVGGNWLNNGSYIGNGVKVIFDGAGTQTISASTFNNLEINKPVGSVAQLTGDVTLKGNLAGTSGTLDIKSFFFNRDVVGGTATITDSATLIVPADNAPNKFANYSLSSNSTIIFNGTGTQHLLLPGVVYGNLTFQNAGTKLLYTAITVKGKLLIDTTAIFDAQSNTVNLYGNWQNKGTFTPSTSTVVAAGTGKTLSGVTTFNNMDVTGSYSNLSNMTYNGLLHITSTGSISAAGGILTTMNGDLINNGVLSTFGTTVFTGNVVQNFSLINAVSTFALIVNFNGTVSPVLNSTSAPQYGYLNINNTGGVNPSVGWTVVYGLTVAPGASFNLGTSSHTFMGNVTNNGTITSDGTVSFLPTSNVTVNFGTNFTSTGRVYMGGSGVLTVAGTPVSFGAMNINNTNPAGITPSSDWTMTKTFRVTSGSIFNAGARTYKIGLNFMDGGTFNAGTSTIILNGSGTQKLNTLSPLYNLTLDKTGDSTNLETDLAIGGTLQFIKGKISTGNFNTTILAGGTVTGAAQNTGWVNGKLKKNIAAGVTSKTFEIGDNTSYTPLNFTFGSVSTGGDLTLSTTASEHPSIASSSINAARSLNRYFTVSNNGLQYSNAGVTMNYVTADVDASATTSAFQVQLFNGSSWLTPVTGTRTSSSIMASNLVLPGDMAVGEICNAGTAISYTSSPYCTTAGTATATVTGTPGGVFSSDAGLAINATTGAIDLASSTVGSHNVVYTISANGTCGQYITSATVVIAVAGTWTGTVNNDWNNSGNWACGGVPASTADVVIAAGSANFPIITGINAVNSISIQPTASVTVTGTMQVAGNINNSGTFDISAGTVEMNGTTGQSIPATAFLGNNVSNLVVSNSSIEGVTLTGTLNVYRSLTFSSLAKKLTTNDLLVIKSTAAYTAWVGDVKNVSIMGKTTVERYINTGLSAGQHLKSWEMLTAPTNGQTIRESWMENGLNTATPNGYGTWMTGAGGTGSGFDQATSTPSMKYYSTATGTWIGVNNTFAQINANSGYLVFVRGDRSVFSFSGANSAPVPTVLRTMGTLNTGTQTPVDIAADKFQLVGNPYASQIDFTKLIRVGGAESQFYVWDPTLMGTYGLGGFQTIKKVGSVYLATPAAYTSGSTFYNDTTDYKVIQSGTAFFIHATGTRGTIQFTEDAKTIGVGNRLVNRFNNQVSTLSTSLLAISGTTKTLADGNRVIFDDDQNNDVDGEDALKMINGGENFGLKRNTKSLIIETRNQVMTSDTLYYDMSNLKAQPYQLMFIARNMDPALTARLVDNWTGQKTVINLSDTNFVNINVTSDPLSKAAGRFNLVFSKAAAPLPVTITTVSATRQPDHSVLVDWKVENELNLANYSVERSADGRSFGVVASTAAVNKATYSAMDKSALITDNYYRIRATGNDGKVQYSKTVKVGGLSIVSAISVYPNPVENRIMQVQFTNQQKGNYDIELRNTLGQVIYQGVQLVTGSSVSIKVALARDIAAGTYQLTIKSATGSMVHQAVIIP